MACFVLPTFQSAPCQTNPVSPSNAQPIESPGFWRFWLVLERFGGPQYKLHAKILIIEKVCGGVCLVSSTPVLRLFIRVEHFPPELVYCWDGHLGCLGALKRAKRLPTARLCDLQSLSDVVATTLLCCTLQSCNVLKGAGYLGCFQTSDWYAGVYVP